MGAKYDETSKSFSYVYRGAEGGGFRPIKIGKGQERSLLIPSFFRADGTAVVKDDSSGRDAYYEMSLTDFTLGKKLFDHPRYDIDYAAIDQSSGQILGFGYTGTRLTDHWLDPTLAKLQADLNGAVGAGNALITDWSDDRSKLLVQVGGPSQPGGLYYWDSRYGTMNLIGWNIPALKNRALSPVRTIEYQARDGTRMDAILTIPRKGAGKNLPTIVMPHGGPNARDAEAFDWQAQYLAELGYLVIQPNYRGSSGYGTAFAELGEGQWGHKMQDDLVDALQWAGKQGLADTKRACIMGASYGGYAAMRAAQRDHGHYRCAISYAGVSDLNSMLRYDRNYLWTDAKKYWRKQAPDLKSVSPRNFASEFSMPILIMHGAEDRRVPVKQSRMLADALKTANKPYVYIEQKEGDHHFSREADRRQFLETVRDFFKTA